MSKCLDNVNSARGLSGSLPPFPPMFSLVALLPPAAARCLPLYSRSMSWPGLCTVLPQISTTAPWLLINSTVHREEREPAAQGCCLDSLWVCIGLRGVFVQKKKKKWIATRLSPCHRTTRSCCNQICPPVVAFGLVYWRDRLRSTAQSPFRWMRPTPRAIIRLVPVIVPHLWSSHSFVKRVEWWD